MTYTKTQAYWAWKHEHECSLGRGVECTPELAARLNFLRYLAEDETLPVIDLSEAIGWTDGE